MYHQLIAYLNYWLNEVNVHSLHAPFVYNLYTKCIQNDYNHSEFDTIENTRKKLLHSKLEVSTSNWGASSNVHGNDEKVPVSTIAKKGLTKPKVSRLLSRLIAYNDSKNIIELGTSFGLNTLYLANKEDARVTTFEGAHDIANIALTNFEFFNKQNIELVDGNIDETLPAFTNSRVTIDFAYIDANHRFEPTFRYFNMILKRMHDNSIIVLDDIYWSKEMTKAWVAIKEHPQVTHTIDLFTVGIVFLKPDLAKTHYTLLF